MNWIRWWLKKAAERTTMQYCEYHHERLRDRASMQDQRGRPGRAGGLGGRMLSRCHAPLPVGVVGEEKVDGVAVKCGEDGVEIVREIDLTAIGRCARILR